MGKECSKPLVNSNSPFENGKTKFYAYKNIIFEVFIKNGYLNSVTLF